jgi:hypothetical protein
MTDINKLAKTLDHSRPGNFFYAMPMSKPNGQVMRGHAASIPCEIGESERFACYCPDSQIVNSNPPMGKGQWLTYGYIVMFNRPNTGEMSIMPIIEFQAQNPDFDLWESLCRSASRPDLAEVLKSKLEPNAGISPEQVKTTVDVAPSPFRDVTFESAVIDRQINDKDQ